MNTSEPKIVINGQLLSEGEAMTLRVALQSFLTSLQEVGLGNDDHGRQMVKNYLARGQEINQKMRLTV